MKRIKIAIVLVVVFACIGMFAACEKYSESEAGYYFSAHTSEVVAYDDAANEGAGNLDKAGTYYRFTSAKNQTLTISVRIGQSSFGTAYMYKNGEQIKSETEVGIYSFVYKTVELKKGDKLELHYFWVNSIMASSEKQEIYLMSINNFVISEYDKTTSE